MERELLDVQRRVLGAEHPDTLYTRSNLAASLNGQGRHAEAEQMELELLDVQRRVLGETHPDTLRARSTLSVFLNMPLLDVTAAPVVRASDACHVNVDCTLQPVAVPDIKLVQLHAWRPLPPVNEVPGHAAVTGGSL